MVLVLGLAVALDVVVAAVIVAFRTFSLQLVLELLALLRSHVVGVIPIHVAIGVFGLSVALAAKVALGWLVVLFFVLASV